MNRSKRLLTLTVVLAAACAATFALTTYEMKQEQIKTSDAVILEIPSGSVQSISWEYEKEGLAFQRKADGWLYEKDEHFPVSEEKMEDILSHFESFGTSFTIEHVEDYSQYGLDKPECIIKLNTSDQEYTIKLGDFSKMDQKRYADIGDGNVYLISDDPTDFLDSELSSMILHDTIPAFKQVSDVQFSGAEDYTIVYKKDSKASYQDEDIYFTKKNGNTLPLDTAAVSRYVNTITSLSLQDYVTYYASDEEFERYGLTSPTLSVMIHSEDTDFTLSIGQDSEEHHYARVGDSKIIYEITDYAYDVLSAASYDDLRHQEIFWANFDQITKMDLTLEGSTHTLTRSNDLWYYKEAEIEIADLQNALESLTADSFTDEAAKQKEELQLTIYLDNDSFPQVKLQLYRYDGSFCLAVVDGKSISLVKRSAVIDLVEAVQSIILN